MSEKNLKKLDIVLFILFPLFAAAISYFFKVNYFTSIMLFFGLPAIYLSFRNKHAIIKSVIFSITFSLLFTTGAYVAVHNGAWYVPNTVFPFRIFWGFAIEDLMIALFFSYLVVIFYEHFIDKSKYQITEHRIKYLILPVIILAILFLCFYILKLSIFDIPLVYLYLG